MEVSYAYMSDSLVDSGPHSTRISFAPDTRRPPTFFRGLLRNSIPFREAISALHDVVVSDLRWCPKDRTEYLAWRARQEEIDWVAVAAQRADLKQKIQDVKTELEDLRARSADRMSPFYHARRRYFDYLYKRDYDAWFVLDPVITVHPDELFFECFSQDESSYGRLSVGLDTFRDVGEFSCGTTNIDYSSSLYDEFQKIRSYKSTQFEIDPSGFEVQTSGEQTYKEVRIDLPDSWVRGFLQVSSAMSLSSTSFVLHPMDVHNLCMILRRNKEQHGPRSLRYLLTPGEPVSIVLDPWGTQLRCPRSRYDGNNEQEIRIWGRRRIHTLERLIPVAKKFTIHLLGTGMPSFYIADLGDMTFTLGLSGWTTNDWATAGNFDLLAPRADVDSLTQRRVFDALKENWRETPASLATRLGLDRSVVLGELGVYAPAGRASWELSRSVYQVRELCREPLPLQQLRFASAREQRASDLVQQNAVHISQRSINDRGVLALAGTVCVRERRNAPTAKIDADQRLIEAFCDCNWYRQNGLRKGPCECVLALRMQHSRQLDGNRFGLN